MAAGLKLKMKGFKLNPKMFKSGGGFRRRPWRQFHHGPMGRAGAFMRGVMKRLIRKDVSKSGNLPSKPGKPPKSRAAGHPFRQIEFKVTALDTKLYVGHEGKGQKQTPMEVHEFGKKVRVVEYPTRQKAHSRRQADAYRKKILSGQIKPPKRVGTVKMIQLPKRPFAKPTLEVAKKKIPSLWRNSVANIKDRG